MSATNRTTNYNLPIFIETDKPAWLVDFNGAMRSIDAQMKINADAIATKSPVLTFNDTADIDFTKSGDIITANLSSGIAGNISRALLKPLSAPTSEEIVTVDTSGNQNSLAIGSGLKNESGVLSAIDLNLTDITVSNSISEQTTSIAYSSGSITSSLNSDKSIGKLYGNLTLTGGTNNVNNEFYTGLTVAPTGTEYFITNAGLSWQFTGSTLATINVVSFRINATGKVYARVYKVNANPVVAWFAPSVYFFKNFGDET